MSSTSRTRVHHRVEAYERMINSGQEGLLRDEVEPEPSMDEGSHSQYEAESSNRDQSQREEGDVTDSEGRGMGTDDDYRGAYNDDEEIDRDERGSSTIAAEGAEGESDNSADNEESYKKRKILFRILLYKKQYRI